MLAPEAQITNLMYNYAELIVHGEFRRIDLSVFDYSRIAEGRPLFERNVI